MALLSLFSGINWRCGSRFRNRFIFNVPFAEFAETLGPVDRVGALYVDEGIRREMASKLQPLGDKILAAAIGASKVHKQWPVSNWVDLVSRAGESGWGICLLGHGEEEEAKARAIVSAAKTERIVNLVGLTDLPRSIAAVQLSRALVAGDTGLLHVAMGSGIPAIGLFGPTLPEQGGLEAVDRKLFAPCPDRGCNRWDCPRTDCLGSIGADAVFQEMISVGKK